MESLKCVGRRKFVASARVDITHRSIAMKVRIHGCDHVKGARHKARETFGCRGLTFLEPRILPHIRHRLSVILVQRAGMEIV